MKTTSYVKHGKNITERLELVNPVKLLGTSILVLATVVVSPHFHHINYLTVVVALMFISMLGMRFLHFPSNLFIPISLVLTAGISSSLQEKALVGLPSKIASYL